MALEAQFTWTDSADRIEAEVKRENQEYVLIFRRSGIELARFRFALHPSQVQNMAAALHELAYTMQQSVGLESCTEQKPEPQPETTTSRRKRKK